MSISLSDIIACAALMISLFTFYKQLITTKREHRTAIRIDVESKGNEVKILLCNIGNTIVKIQKTSYYFSIDDNDSDTLYMKDIASFFYNVDCITKTAENIDDNYLFPNSTHNLFYVTVPTQDALLDVWKIIKHITANINYEDTYGNKQSQTIELASSYKSFEEALTDQESIIKPFLDPEIEALRKKMRTLKVFQKENN